MTIKERLHQIVDRLPERKAESLLDLLQEDSLSGEELPAPEQDHIALVKALRGRYASTGHRVDDYLKEKHDETERQEALRERLRVEE